MTTRIENYIRENGLIEGSDPENDKPIYRRAGFDGVVDFEEIDRRVSDVLREARDATGLTHADVAAMLGLHPIAYGRYERAETRLNVSRLIHFSELLDFSPVDLIMAVAPHRYGKNPVAAERRRRLMKIVETLPDDAVESMVSLLEAMSQVQPR